MYIKLKINKIFKKKCWSEYPPFVANLTNRNENNVKHP